ncbi:site-specific integrase [Nodularia sp. UHCC 0506]|uniref:site-specific integrase n=1 Tax=Nodularia sp. UHCC 0506 TaxID=3110243 RepID=UPI002B2200A4|nr:site-specific integrase [Nodularia sp. UHCC 0506]MEA5516741.1 site-specific integrase [Nodularia sp. UHCC 0506]
MWLVYGLTEKVSCHWLRHSHATHNAERGTPVPLIQQTMGHADIATTSGYIHIRPGDSSALHLPRV